MTAAALKQYIDAIMSQIIIAFTNSSNTSTTIIEEGGGGSSSLQKSNNLSDIDNVEQALLNLGAGGPGGPVLTDSNNNISKKIIAENITAYTNINSLKNSSPGSLSGNYYVFLLYGVTFGDNLGGNFILNNSATVDNVSVFSDNSNNIWQRQNENVSMSVYDILIPATTQTTILSYTPVGNKNLEINVFFRVITGNTNISITVSYTDNGGTNQSLTLVINPDVDIGNYSIPSQIINVLGPSPVALKASCSEGNRVYISATFKPY